MLRGRPRTRTHNPPCVPFASLHLPHARPPPAPPRPALQDIGGLDVQKQEMREAVELPLTHFDLYQQIGIDPPRGVLMYGPPGTGKTMMAKAVAHATTANFISVVGSEFVQKYLGEVRGDAVCALHLRCDVLCAV